MTVQHIVVDTKSFYEFIKNLKAKDGYTAGSLKWSMRLGSCGCSVMTGLGMRSAKSPRPTRGSSEYISSCMIKIAALHKTDCPPRRSRGQKGLNDAQRNENLHSPKLDKLIYSPCEWLAGYDRGLFQP